MPPQTPMTQRPLLPPVLPRLSQASANTRGRGRRGVAPVLSPIPLKWFERDKSQWADRSGFGAELKSLITLG